MRKLPFVPIPLACLAVAILGFWAITSAAATARPTRAPPSSPALVLDLIPDIMPCSSPASADSSRSVFAGEPFTVDACWFGDPAALGTGRYVAVIDAQIIYDDTVVVAPEVALPTTIDANPDLDQLTLSGTAAESGWHCFFPAGDTDPAGGPEHGNARVGCLSAHGPAVFDPGSSGRLFSVTFNVVGAAGSASALALQNASLSDLAVREIGSCNPAVRYPVNCAGGIVSVGASSVTPAATATRTATPVATATPVETPVSIPPQFSLDLVPDATACGSRDTADQTRTVAPGDSFRVDGCWFGDPATVGSGPSIGVFQADIIYDDTVIVAPEVSDLGIAVDDNPDFDQAALAGNSSGAGWDCSGMGVRFPKGDKDRSVGPGHGDAHIGCYTVPGPAVLDRGQSGRLFSLSFNATGGIGSATALAVQWFGLTDTNVNEIGSCNPETGVPVNCTGGTVSVQAPSATPTPTDMSTSTPTATPTPSPIPEQTPLPYP